MTATLTFIPCSYSPRVENLADFAASVRAIRNHGIPQILHLHPEDIAAVERIIHPLHITDGITHRPADPLESSGFSHPHPNGSSPDPSGSQRPSLPAGHDTRYRCNSKGLRAIEGITRALSLPEVRQALAPYWNKHSMLLQLVWLERLRLELLGLPVASRPSVHAPARPATAGSPAPSHQTPSVSIPSPDSTTAAPAHQAPSSTAH
jgi:hypothetical protein